MEKIDKLKSKRGHLRTSVTKLMSKAQTLLSNTVENTNCDEIIEVLAQINNKEAELNELNSEIESLLDDPLEFEKEFAAVEDYADRLFNIVFKLKNRIKLCKPEEKAPTSQDVPNFGNGTSNPENRTSGFQNKSSTALKLPKLSIKSFNGDPAEFLEFFNSFSNAIDENESLSKIEKFVYLKSLLAGPAYNMVSGFSISEKNYDACIQLMKDRFGKRENIIACHMNKLLSIEGVRYSSNVRGLRKLYEECEICIRNLESQDVTSGSYGHLLIPILLKLIPQDMVLEYHRKRDPEKNDVTNLIKFIKEEIECREAAFLTGVKDQNLYIKNRNGPNNGRNTPAKSIPSTATLNTASRVSKFCIFCKSNLHYGSQCTCVSDESKRAKLKREGRCYRCFRFHLSRDCKIKVTCDKCKGSSHIQLFCTKDSKPEIKESESEVQTVLATMSHSEQSKTVLLQTCSVVASCGEKKVDLRLLLDSGSERSFVLKSVAEILNLKPIRKERLLVYSFGKGTPEFSEFDLVQLTLHSKWNHQRKINVEALITSEISGASLNSPIDEKVINSFIAKHNIQLADMGCGKLQVLLGMDYMCEVICGKPSKLTEHLFMQNTLFGCTVQGRIENENSSTSTACFRVSTADEFSTENDLKCLWNVENILPDHAKELTVKDEQNIIGDFEKQLEFENGRYKTKLLWNVEKGPANSNNFKNAKQRFNYLIRKFKRDKWLLNSYCEVIDDYLQKGIVEKCAEDIESAESYYMPHHAVVRNDKETTKVRIVFDASSKEQNCLALNQRLNAGPNLNPDILTIILKFRSHEIAFCSDLEKAFLQIMIDVRDRDFLRFIWLNEERELSEDHWQVMRMTRVPFGVSCSPFLLAATIKAHIKRYQKSHPLSYYMLNTSLYVDDLFSGGSTVQEAFQLSSEAVSIFKDANMCMRKFSTNSKELDELWRNSNLIEINELSVSPLKVLGLIWDNNEDTLRLDLRSVLSALGDCKSTKRNVLHIAAKIFDPAGFISPFLVRVKCLLQELWQLGVDWDEIFSGELKEKWLKWCNEITALSNFKIPRYYFSFQTKAKFESLQLHVFADASPVAYGAVAYVRFGNLEEIKTSFIMSKSRVAPLKKLTLPRLELLGAVIASRLTSYLKNLFEVSDKDIYCWSDSTITLHWIHGSPTKWKQFVSNRVTEIQELTEPESWRHCDGKDNPADLLSRGYSARELLNSQIWLKGPRWLSEDQHNWPEPKVGKPFNDSDVAEEKRNLKKMVVNLTNTVGNIFCVLGSYSSWTTLKRVMAWCLRFLNNTRLQQSQRKYGFLTVAELDIATNIICKIVQQHEFREDYNRLKEGKELSNSSKILSLYPFIDKNGVLRVGGRLRNSQLSEGERHPIILPKSHHVTNIIVNHYHQRNLHSGVQLTLSSIRQTFWIINAKEVIRKCIWLCVRCHRYRKRISSQLMGDLPKVRVTPARAFARTGVDFAGPFHIKMERKRGSRPVKVYVCLFVCFTTKAIHLEIVKDLTTDAFIASLRRFTARRGKPEELFSDRGTNFTGADKELKRMFASCMAEKGMHDYFTNDNIKWIFNPPAAPHFGGLWEAGVKQMKGHLKRTIGGQILTYEEFLTLLAQVEACLNSRPIVAMSSDAKDLSALTPGHFIIGAPLNSIPEPNLINEKISPLKRWRLTQQLQQSFWKRWSKDYLGQLQQRPKWTKTKRDFKCDDLVLICDNDQPPLKWKLGRIIELYPGKDNLVRVVKLRTATQELKRPIAKLALLPFCE